jgi:hypothetical protein
MSNTLYLTVFLALVALHCVAYEPGIEAELRISGAPPTVAFHTDAGERVELDEAILHIDAVELRACAPSARAYGLRSVAYAHGLESGSGPWRLDLATGGTINEILRPAPGEYCEVVLHVDGQSFDAVAARLVGRIEGASMAEEAPGPFDIVLPLAEPLELDDPGDRPAFEVRLDQRELFDHEGTLAERLDAISQLAVR